MPIYELGGRSGGGSPDCPFDGNITYPASGTHVVGTTCADFKNLFFETFPPIAHISIVPAFGIREIGDDITNPVITGRSTIGNNGDPLDRIEWRRGGALINTQLPAVYGVNYPYTDVLVISTNTQYCVRSFDTGARQSNNACGNYTFTWPFYGTSVNLTTLTKQALVALTSAYFQVSMVAEAGIEKQKAEFHNTLTITGVQFYNTVSSAWEWLNGSKIASLASWTTSPVTETVQGSVENYTRFTHNGIMVGARQLRFWRT